MTTNPLTYADLQQLAKNLKRPASTLFALAPCNDPFYIGTSRQAAAEWFLAQWQRFHFSPGAHIRRIHYVLVVQSPGVQLPHEIKGSMVYANTEACWQFLNVAVRDARYLGLINVSDIEDHRNAEALLNFDGTETDATLNPKQIEYVAPAMDLPTLELDAPRIPQRYVSVIFIEKSTMNDVILPIAERYGADVMIGTGETSLTRCAELVDRIATEGRPVRILYISDFDPAGDSMPTAAARKIEFEIRNNDHEVDVQLRPIALTKEQVIQYNLPPVPIKEEERRATAFMERRNVGGAVELDALEALQPGVLAQLLETEIQRHFDHQLEAAIENTKRDVQTDLERINEEVRARHADQIQELEWEHERVLQAIRVYNIKAARFLPPITTELVAEAPDVNNYDWPDANDFEGDETDDPLFDSGRNYVTQIDRYKAHQKKPTDFNRIKVTAATSLQRNEAQRGSVVLSVATRWSTDHAVFSETRLRKPAGRPGCEPEPRGPAPVPVGSRRNRTLTPLRAVEPRADLTVGASSASTVQSRQTEPGTPPTGDAPLRPQLTKATETNLRV